MHMFVRGCECVCVCLCVCVCVGVYVCLCVSVYVQSTYIIHEFVSYECLILSLCMFDVCFLCLIVFLCLYQSASVCLFNCSLCVCLWLKKIVL